MIRAVAEWAWRLAVLAALCWIGWELHQIHEDMFEPDDDEQIEAKLAAPAKAPCAQPERLAIRSAGLAASVRV